MKERRRPMRAAGPERLETERLVIRRPVAADAPVIFSRYASDPEVTKFLGWPTHRTVDDTRNFLQFSDVEWKRWLVGPYLLESRDGRVVGSTGLSLETATRASTGYVLARDAWGRGYATEALQTMIIVARSMDVRRLYAICYVDHPASAHVLDKCGFEREGVLKKYAEFPNLAPGEPSDVLCYSLIL
jgi:ribosomal-protein-alanine N-acetyltransferase